MKNVHFSLWPNLAEFTVELCICVNQQLCKFFMRTQISTQSLSIYFADNNFFTLRSASASKNTEEKATNFIYPRFVKIFCQAQEKFQSKSITRV